MYIREEDGICLFKIADGTTIYCEEPSLYDDGIRMDMSEAFILISKTNAEGQSEIALYASKELMFGPSIMYFPWTSIITATDIDDEVRQKIKAAIRAKDTKPNSPAKEQKKALDIDRKY